MKIRPRRLLIQIAFFFAQNPLPQNFLSGKIYQGRLKMLCTPGLNCYTCPAAVSSCPIGALQFFLAGAKQSVSLFVGGFLLAVGAVFGRLICGYVCPMGLLQDLLYKIKTPKWRPLLRVARYLKYAVLTVLVVALPLMLRNELSGLGDPWFCKYVCPSGMIFGALPLLLANGFLREMAGSLFIWKALLALAVILASVIVYRIFCRVLCPLGAIYSLFNRFALFRLRCDREACISCGKCADACLLAIDAARTPGAAECVSCGDCIKACPTKALGYRPAR